MFSDLFIRDIEICKPSADEDSYIFHLPVIKNLVHMDRLYFHSRVTFLVGENGSGKSTLLEAIAVACSFNAEGGTRNFNFASRETHSDLHRYLTIARGIRKPTDGFFLRAESFYNVATKIEHLDEEDGGLLAYYGGQSLHRQSHGESFLTLVMNRFGGDGLYLLDEPEAALSPSRQLSLLVRINDLVRKNSQFIIATHSPILMAFPGAEILVLSDEGIVPTPFDQTEHYTLTKQFLNNPEGMIRYLFDE